MKKITIYSLLALTISIASYNQASANRIFSKLRTKVIYNNPEIDISIDPNGEKHIIIGDQIAVGYQDYCSFSLRYSCDTTKQKIVKTYFD